MSDSVLCAVIGASIAIIGLMVSKESKTSEFRQQWIDGLRNDLAILISSALHYSNDSAVTRAVNESTSRLRLRLNPEEERSKELLESIFVLNGSVNNTDARNESGRVARVFVEAGESAKSADRPQFQAMFKFLTLAGKGRISRVIVYKFDRFSRNVEDGAVYRMQLRKLGRIGWREWPLAMALRLPGISPGASLAVR